MPERQLHPEERMPIPKKFEPWQVQQHRASYVEPVQSEFALDLNIRDNCSLPVPPNAIRLEEPPINPQHPENAFFGNHVAGRRHKTVLSDALKVQRAHYRSQEPKFVLEETLDFPSNLDMLLEEVSHLHRLVNEYHQNLPQPFQEIVVRVHRDDESLKTISKDQKILEKLTYYFRYSTIQRTSFQLVSHAYYISLHHIKFTGTHILSAQQLAKKG